MPQQWTADEILEIARSFQPACLHCVCTQRRLFYPAGRGVACGRRRVYAPRPIDRKCSALIMITLNRECAGR